MLTIGLLSGAISAGCSFVFFTLCNRLCHQLIKISHTSDTYDNDEKKNNAIIQQPPIIHTFFTDSNFERWQRKNISISFLHAFITGVLAVYSCWTYSPDIHRDYVKHITLLTYLTCSFSCGYFFFDLIDIISNRRGSELLEMMLHHILTIIMFGTSIINQLNIGYQMLALIAEVNSVFLHLRKLFHLFGIPREHLVVRMNMIVNLITFVICRLGILTYGTISIINDGQRIGTYYYIFLLYILIPTMFIMNPILFYRLLTTDFLKKRKPDKLTS